MAGNYLADMLRGSNLAHLPEGINLGIKIHRHIDSFTDSHPLVLETRKLLYPYFDKYASVVQDVYYDHFLAKNWKDYSDVDLKSYTANVYAVLDTYKEYYNDRALRALQYMTLQDWLANYATLEGIDRSLKGLSRRAKFASGMEDSIPPLIKHYKAIDAHFKIFFKELDAEIRLNFAPEISLFR